MARYFNGKEVELLAPAGNFEIFEAVIRANCDAVYIGGPSLNMRLMRKGYNFTYEEIIEAANLAHSLDKKLYITLNNMLNETEIDEARDYLHFLDGAGVDGIIVQDFGILQLCKEEGIKNLEIHSSVMMNVHNVEMVKQLQEYGVNRVVVSREMDLKTAKQIQIDTGIEIEYFMHGDMCAVNGANCYYSSVVFGNSGNRGRCMKPCRWEYRIKKDGKVYPTEYPLAAKDMYMYEHIPELIENHVTSFKIEGRMRDKDFVVNLVNIYGDAIDRYINDAIGFERAKDANVLYENRKRDFTTAFAFNKPGTEYMNKRYEGTGKFYSTGKVFSTPTEEAELRLSNVERVKEAIQFDKMADGPVEKKLHVRVNNFEQAKRAIELGVQRVYIQTEVLLPSRFVTADEAKELRELAAGKTEIYLSLPQNMDSLWFDRIDQYLAVHGQLFDGLLVGNIGAVRKYRDKFKLIGDMNLNILNNKSIELYRENGLSEFTATLEMRHNELQDFVNRSVEPVEVIVHGPIKVMYLDYNLYQNLDEFEPIEDQDNKFVDNSVLVLMTDKGENPVYIDQDSRNHLFTAKELNLLPLLDMFNAVPNMNYRIEAQTYSVDELEEVIKYYQTAMKDSDSIEEIFKSMKSNRAGYTLGSLLFQYEQNK